MFVWTEQMSVGIEEIDAQHRHLFSLANRLGEMAAVGADSNRAGMRLLLDDILDYNLYHLGLEEGYMQEFGCVDDLHFKLHRVYRNETKILHDKAKAELKRADGRFNEVAGDLAHFTGEWHLRHIVEMDRRYMECFQTNGLR